MPPTPALEFELLNFNLKSEIWNLRLEILRFAIWHMRFEVLNWKFEIWDRRQHLHLKLQKSLEVFANHWKWHLNESWFSGIVTDFQGFPEIFSTWNLIFCLLLPPPLHPFFASFPPKYIKFLKIPENLWKSLKILENLWKSVKKSEKRFTRINSAPSPSKILEVISNH